jgi:hypothetical protein
MDTEKILNPKRIDVVNSALNKEVASLQKVK